MITPVKQSVPRPELLRASLAGERPVGAGLQARLLEAVGQAVIATDLQGCVTSWNSAAESLYGWSAAEAIGVNILDLVVTERKGLGWAEMLRSVTAGSKSTAERRHCRRDGSYVSVLLSLAPLLDRSGEPEGVVGISIDLTERQNLEEQFRHAQKMEGVGRLAGGIAHDFNNILTAIRITAELLAEDLGSSDPRAAEAMEIVDSVIRGSALTKQLLAFSRKEPVAARMVDVSDLISNLQPMLKRLIGSRIELTTNLRASGHVIADPGQLEQVIVNLIVNARDAMPHGGPVTIETDDTDYHDLADATPISDLGRCTVIAVSDAGTGMDKTTRDRAMEPFFTTKAEGAGTGLGLSTAYGIVKQFGGHLWIYSEPGQGTTVKVYLPNVDATSEFKTLVPTAPDQAATETLLLVEDDLTLRGLASMILEERGYCVLPAGNGREGLQMAAEHAGVIDLVVTDVVMPEMSGRQLVERLTPLRPGIRSLYISGYTNDEIIRRGLLDRDMRLLQKPFTAATLLAEVRSVLDAALK
jgi:two-component system cell cycle sensor histidine kinase/response regulator CckA